MYLSLLRRRAAAIFIAPAPQFAQGIAYPTTQAQTHFHVVGAEA